MHGKGRVEEKEAAKGAIRKRKEEIAKKRKGAIRKRKEEIRKRKEEIRKRKRAMTTSRSRRTATVDGDDKGGASNKRRWLVRFSP